MLTTKPNGWPSGPYSAILADPPWSFQTYSANGKDRSAERHYDVMDLAAIKALPVREIAAKRSVLFLWTTDTHLPQALEVMEAWGFWYTTVAFTWVKLNRGNGEPFLGMGYWTRANPEMCLMGVRGSPARRSRSVRQLVMSPIREHSRKPDEVAASIERLVDGPYCELFGRTHRPDWYSWGDETTRFDGSPAGAQK